MRSKRKHGATFRSPAPPSAPSCFLGACDVVAQSRFSRRPAKTLLPPHLCPGHLHSALILSLLPIFSCSFFFILLLLGQFLSCLLTPAPFRTFSLLLCLVFSPSRAPNFCMLPFITLLQPVTQITPHKPLPPQALVKCKEQDWPNPLACPALTAGSWR